MDNGNSLQLDTVLARRVPSPSETLVECARAELVREMVQPDSPSVLLSASQFPGDRLFGLYVEKARQPDFPVNVADPETLLKMLVLEAHTPTYVAARFGVAPKSVASIVGGFEYALAELLSVEVEKAREVMYHSRAEKLVSPWRPWCRKFAEWTKGGETPPDIAYNFNDLSQSLKYPLFFETFYLPWKEIARTTPVGRISCERLPKMEAHLLKREVPQVFVFTIRNPQGEIQRQFLMADSEGTRYVPLSKNYQHLTGPMGHFTRLLMGEGPVCLITAFSQRQIRETEKTNGLSRYVDLISPQSAIGRPGLHINLPRVFQGDYVIPSVSLPHLRVGQTASCFDLFAATRDGQKLNLLIGSYTIERDTVRGDSENSGQPRYRFYLDQTKGALSSWQNLEARRNATSHATAWLEENRDLHDGVQLGVFDLKRRVKHLPDGSHESSKHSQVIFNRQNLFVPESYQGDSLKGWLFFIENRQEKEGQILPHHSRFLGFWPPEANPFSQPPVVVVYREGGKTKRLNKGELPEFLRELYPRGETPVFRHF